MKKYITSMSVVALTAMLVGTFALAADTGSVSATVTASLVAVTVTSGVITYGTVATTKDTTTGVEGVDDTKTITNTGTVNADFEIKGQNSTGNVWTLAGAGGDATYAHKTCIATCDAGPSWTALTTSYVDLDTAKAPAGTTELDLQVTVPTSNPGATEATLPVDVLATAS